MSERFARAVTFFVLALSLFAAIPTASLANSATASLCDAAAVRAADRHDVPRDILLSLTRTETGRSRAGQIEPWPWAVNRAGDGRWFETRDAALSFATTSLRSGHQNFDIGCFQINFRWHKHHFTSLAAMFDPEANADYAARFVRDLHREFGSWTRAAGAFHSRTPEHSSRYLKRFGEIRAGLDPRSVAVNPARADPPREPGTAKSRELFAAATPASGASLVPLPSRGSLPFADQTRRKLFE